MDITEFLKHVEKMMKEFEQRDNTVNSEQFNFGNANKFFDSELFNQQKSPVHELLYDVTEEEENVVVTIDLPGFSKENIDIQSDEMHVRVEAEATSDMRRESVSHTFYLPTEVIPEESTAEFENGVLTVTLPKLEPDEDEDDATTISID